MITYITPDYIRGGNEHHNKWLSEMYEKDKNFFDDTFKIFLAGTIDNGDSYDWQYDVFLHLAMYTEILDLKGLTVFSPRRKNWKEDSTQEDVEQQIKWEQEKLDKADLIVMVFQDNSKSPISLLELGLYGPTGKLICFCTPNFYRYTNVKLTCEKWGIPLIEQLSTADIAAEIDRIYKECK